MLVAWIVVPVVALALLAGWGALTARVCGARIDGALLPGVGLAGAATVGAALLTFAATHALAVPVLAVGGLVGLGLLTVERRPGAAWLPAIGTAIVVIGALGAPSLLSGQGVVAGYVQLDDPATWMGLTGHLFDHGRPVGDIPVGTARRAVESYLGLDYPIGAFVAPGAVSRLTGLDLAVVLQPLLATLGAAAALGALALLRPLTTARWAPAVAAAIGLQASAFVAFANWGGIKEVTAVALLPVTAALLARIVPHVSRPRGLPAEESGTGALLVVCGAGLLCVLGILGAVWAAAPLLAGIAVLALRRQVVGTVVAAGMSAATALAIEPTLRLARAAQDDGVLGLASELGNLEQPLPALQAVGLWPRGDFRDVPDPQLLHVLLALLVGVLAVAGAGAAARRGRPQPAVLLVLVLSGASATWLVGSPWVDAKGMAIAAPAILLAACALALLLPTVPRAALLTGLGALAAVSTGQVAGAAWVAPRASFADLEHAGELLDGRGPTLALDPDPYAGRHFLRRAAADGASDLRQRPISLRDGTIPQTLAHVDVEQVTGAALGEFRAIVRRRSPVASRPPAGFARRWAGARWEVWERTGDRPKLLADLPLGAGVDPGATVACPALDDLAATPGARRLVAAPAPALVLADAATWAVPDGWRATDVRPRSDGEARVPVDVPRTGRWRIWVGGTILGRLSARAAGQDAGHVRHQLAHGAPWLRLGTVELRAGRQEVVLRHEGRAAPGPVGPLALTPVAADDPPALVTVPVGGRRVLCDGRRLDWVAALP